MGHPSIENRTPFAFEPLFVADENGRPIMVPLVKATYEIRKGGKLSLADEQRPIQFTGERWGPAEDSSYKYEPETAFVKPATDVVLIGSACAQSGVTRQLDVVFRVGPLEKRASVSGDRTWVKRIGGSIGMTDAHPFERIPLTYERAFGGWDRSHSNPEKHAFEPRNPVGTGFRRARGTFEEGIGLPNIEDPKRRIKSYGDAADPVGFGFISPDWQPRAALAGTYDAAWLSRRMPSLPHDFDSRFFNAASAGLVTNKLTGDESVVAQNVTPDGELTFRLPRVPCPHCRVQLFRGPDAEVETRLDTVIVNTDEHLLLLVWRSIAPLPAEPHHVRAIETTVDGVPLHAQ